MFGYRVLLKSNEQVWRLTELCMLHADKPALTQQYKELYFNNSVDIILMPATPSTAPPIYSVEPYMLFNGKYLSNRVVCLPT